MYENIRNILNSKYPKELIDELLKSHNDIKDNYILGKYKTSELEGGFFVESVRRIIEIELFNRHINLDDNLNHFNDQEMRRYENGNGNETFRLHIPRVLRSIYNLRNKRGVGHLSEVNPNIIDSTFIVTACDWTLAEIIRIKSDLDIDKCQKIINGLVERKLPVIYDSNDIIRVLDTTLSVKQQVLLILYHTGESVTDDNLLKFTEYSNSSLFKRKILKELHKKRKIEYRNKVCEITPLGLKEVERIVKSTDFA